MSRKKIISKEDVEREYLNVGRNINEASVVLGCSSVTLRKRMKELGLKAKNHSWNTHSKNPNAIPRKKLGINEERVPWNKGQKLETKYPELRDKEWLQSQLNRTSMRALSEEIGCSYKRVYDAKIELGVEPQNGIIKRAAAVPYPVIIEKKEEIIDSYLNGKSTTRELSVKFNVPFKSMTYYLHRKWGIGLPIVVKTTRPDGRVVSKEEIESVYFRKNVTSVKAAKELGISVRAFRDFLKKYGIETKKRQSGCVQLRDTEWLINEYVGKDKTTREIAREQKTTIGVVQRALQNINVELRRKDGVSLGDKNPNWKGGRKTFGKENKYIGIYSPDHPFCTKDGRVMEHRLAMEKKIGRYLKKEEIVHHKNGIKDDNRIENLELVKNQGQHTKDHFKRSNRTELAELETERIANLYEESELKVKELEKLLSLEKKTNRLEKLLIANGIDPSLDKEK